MKHFLLRTLDYTSVGAEEFLICERMRKRVAKHNRRTQVSAAIQFRFAQAIPMSCSGVPSPRRPQTFFNGCIYEFRHLRIGKTGELCFLILRLKGSNWSQFFRERFGNFRTITSEARCAGTPLDNNKGPARQVQE